MPFSKMRKRTSPKKKASSKANAATRWKKWREQNPIKPDEEISPDLAELLANTPHVRDLDLKSMADEGETD